LVFQVSESRREKRQIQLQLEEAKSNLDSTVGTLSETQKKLEERTLVIESLTREKEELQRMSDEAESLLQGLRETIKVKILLIFSIFTPRAEETRTIQLTVPSPKTGKGRRAQERKGTSR